MGEKQEKQANAINATWDYLKDSLLQLFNSTLWTDHHFLLVLYHKWCSIVQQKKKKSKKIMLMVVSVYRMFLQEYCKAVCSTKYKLNVVLTDTETKRSVIFTDQLGLNCESSQDRNCWSWHLHMTRASTGLTNAKTSIPIYILTITDA